MPKKTIDVLTQIANAQTVDELWLAFSNAMASYGFTRLLYGYSRFITNTGLGSPNDHLLLTNFPKEYVDGFVNSDLFIHAPMVQWSMNNTGAKSWSYISEQASLGKYSQKTLEVIEFNAKHGVTAGYTISFRTDPITALGGISLAAPTGTTQSDVDAMWAIHEQEIMLINNFAHVKILTLPHNTSSGQKLTNRQREVLSWVSDGKTAQDIAVLLGVSIQTVEKHLRLAREVLGVETTAQAVLRLALQNQIYTNREK